MNKRRCALGLTAALLLSLLAGCGSGYPDPPSSDPVTITIAGPWTDCPALEEAGQAFTAVYSNCTVNYEYLQNYNDSVTKRMEPDTADPIDLFLTDSIQEESPFVPYALDLNSCENLDLSNAFDGLINNFTYREENAEAKKLYSVPLGAEMRGLYVNKTLLNSLNIAMPTDQESLLAACATLKENGYIPLQGNPSGFSQQLLYPWICNIIANADDYDATYASVNDKTVPFSELFKEPFSFLYTLVENGYYDYKTAQTELGTFNSAADEDVARDFLNIAASGDDYAKIDDVGRVAFMPGAISLLSVVDKTKEDYHSGIEYEFLPAPVSAEGGFVYLSPAKGIAINKNSVNTEWGALFLNFLFSEKENETFSEAYHCIPNNKDAFAYISKLYDVPDGRISELGQVTFDYGFYQVIRDSLTDISKANNPKYMQPDPGGTATNEDGEKVSLYSFDYFMEQLDQSVKES